MRNPDRLTSLTTVMAVLLLSAACDSTSLRPTGLPMSPVSPSSGTTFTISGAVTETTASGPMPVAGAMVMELSTRAFALTGEDGSYTLPGLRAMNTSVSVTKSGYVTHAKALDVTGDTRLDIVISRAPIPQTYVLSGLVYEVTAAGRVPIDGVVLYCDGCGSPEGHTFVTTDAEGLYSLSWVWPGVTYLQVIGKTGFKLRRSDSVARNTRHY